jgi:hypothetical protein
MTLKIPSTRKSPVKKTTTAKINAPTQKDKRHQMISEAAYILAEQRNFHGDRAMDDWLQAEAEVDTILKKKD